MRSAKSCLAAHAPPTEPRRDQFVAVSMNAPTNSDHHDSNNGAIFSHGMTGRAVGIHGGSLFARGGTHGAAPHAGSWSSAFVGGWLQSPESTKYFPKYRKGAWNQGRLEGAASRPPSSRRRMRRTATLRRAPPPLALGTSSRKTSVLPSNPSSSLGIALTPNSTAPSKASPLSPTPPSPGNGAAFFAGANLASTI